MTHLLHAEIGEVLGGVSLGRCKLLRDSACGGKQNIPLFVGRPKSNETECCNVDVLFLDGGRVRGIVEIEEGNIVPTQVCGKFLTSALASFYQHARHGDVPIPIQDAFFIQIVDSSKLKRGRTAKLAQLGNIARSIENVLPLPAGGISYYKLFMVNGPGDSEGIESVMRWISESLPASPN